jgi:hypothetical protein
MPLRSGTDPIPHAEGTLGDYQRALAEGDLEGIVGSFESDGRAREPGGRRTYAAAPRGYGSCTHACSPTAAAPLWSTAPSPTTTPGAPSSTTARWEVTDIPPRAGVAAYERGSSGLLSAARIYDDVEPPAVSDTSENRAEVPRRLLLGK